MLEIWSLKKNFFSPALRESNVEKKNFHVPLTIRIRHYLQPSSDSFPIRALYGNFSLSAVKSEISKKFK